ncbi:thiol-disulfide oxidoreductase [Bacillus sp. M6-12]|uniref:thiol-disulfide oxidoreductase DCC family protein n=1 Tax=Bacillus sp. M6-12 TaxID=2054166 RepID=UPI000C76BB55|nr:thiol-disulfide oxidoreductase DCC family protein [Bacillus sp. M6-12]PLS18862.1 thiol-disulfide oxidoreductase [Bacillus sp. M6-12]
MQGIILFDGDCSFCNRSVQFIIKRDPKGYFQFASQQSEIGQELRKKYRIPDNIDSLLLIENNHCYQESTAVLKICKHLTGVWKAGFLFLFIPKPLRDFFYRIIAKNRYKWFGKQDRCMLPSPEIRNRFLS